jgi:pimeloyl-ACP methyl ester carboxylesterase
LLVLHGLCSNARAYDPFARTMADRCHVLALDQRGHGETDWAADYAHARWVEDIEAFVAALGLGPISIVGNSVGGLVGYLYAGRHPVAVSRLVVVDWGPQSGATDSRYRKEPGAVKVPWWPSEFEAPRDAVRARRDMEYPVAKRMPLDELERIILCNLRQRDDGRWVWQYDPVFIPPNDPQSDLAEEIALHWRALARITCPTLLVMGEHGFYSWERDTVERMLQVLSRGELVVIPGAGHLVAHDNFPAFLDAVRAFLSATITSVA